MSSASESFLPLNKLNYIHIEEDGLPNESPSGKNPNVDTIKTNLDDGIPNETKGNLSSILDTTIDLKSDAGTSKGTKAHDERPGMGPRQISSAISTDHRGYTNHSKEQVVANKNVEIKCKSRITSSTYHGQDYLTPKPQERGLDIRGLTGTPTQYLSHDSLTLAQLYHSSRRSRHSSPHRLINSDFIPPSPLSMDRQHLSLDTSAVQEKNNSETEWPFHIASPVFYDSCSSVCSAESEELLAQEAITACELFGEDGVIEQQSKRRRTSPGE